MSIKLSDNLELTLSIIEYKSILKGALDSGSWHCPACKDNGIIYADNASDDRYCDCELGQYEERRDRQNGYYLQGD